MVMRSSDLKSIIRARRLRCEATSAENKLWSALRNRQIRGFKFVHQESISPYFTDFLCRSLKLVIEIDGATHETPEERASDAHRTAFPINSATASSVLSTQTSMKASIT